MDEQMIDEMRDAMVIAWADADADPSIEGTCDKLARAAHSVMAGKVAELEGALKRLIADSVTVAGLCDLLIPGTQIFDAIEQARAALAPYPERRSE